MGCASIAQIEGVWTVGGVLGCVEERDRRSHHRCSPFARDLALGSADTPRGSGTAVHLHRLTQSLGCCIRCWTSCEV